MTHALLVIDLIEDYFDETIWPNSVIPSLRSELTGSVNELVDRCRRAGVPIVWIRQEFQEDMADAFRHARQAGMRYAVRGTSGSRLLQGLDVRKEDSVLIKKRFSAFYDTSLDALLAEMGVSTVILAGITTAWCVRSTAVDAYQRDFRVILAAHCTAAFDVATHRESLVAMDGYIAESLSNAEIQQRLPTL